MTPKQSTFSLLRLLWPLFILLAACSPSTTETPETIPPTATTTVLSDCFWSATAVAWLDANGDGVRDEGELPLEGIEFVLEPTVYSRTTSDAEGVAHIFATTPTAGTDTTCAELATEMPLQVMATRFEGYHLTTAGSLAYTSSEVEYAFGFQAETALAEPTTDLLVVAEEGYALAPDWSVTQVNYLFEWYGENWPVWEYEQIIAAADGHFWHGNGSNVTPQVDAFLASLQGLTPVDEMRDILMRTDDYPEWTIDIVGNDGQRVRVTSQSTAFYGHAPWYVQIGSQLYQQTSGEIGFSVYALVSAQAQEYFSLEAAPYDADIMAGNSNALPFAAAPPVIGLLPVAEALTYQYDAASGSLSGTFIWDTGRSEYDSSSHPITGVATIQRVLPDSTTQPCSLSSTPDENHPAFIYWSFVCTVAGETFTNGIPLRMEFATASGELLVVEGAVMP